MVRFFSRFFAIVGFLFLVGLIGSGYLVYTLLFKPTHLPSTILLRLDITQEPPEYGERSPLAGFLFGSPPSLRDLVDAVDRAQGDARVKGILLHVSGKALTLSQAEELRAALLRFRGQVHGQARGQEGRFIHVYADTFGEFGPAHDAYYLASAGDRIWLQPMGTIGLTGLVAETPFLREAFDQWGIEPEMEHRKEYKSAMESLTEKDFSPAHREMTESLLDDLTDQLVRAIADGRRLTPGEIRNLIDRGPLLDREALAAGLVDEIGYADQALAAAKSLAGEGVKVVKVFDYLDGAEDPYDSGPGIALVHVVGAIERGSGHSDRVMGEQTVGADTVVAALEEAVRDDDVKAIVLRISSPGGSAVASESIRRAVLQAREKKKPVIVSMGDVAASGGYWVAMDGDRILADAATLTGSIGVFGGKVVIGKLLQRLGISLGAISRGRNARMWSNAEPFSESHRERLSALLDSIYDGFVERAAQARRMDRARMESLARGRVWTGRQAASNGLIDEVGDFRQALIRAREAIGLKPEAPIQLLAFPKPRSTLDRLLELAGMELGVWISQAFIQAGWENLSVLLTNLTQTKVLVQMPMD